ncbi:hypothetical protein BDZ94DRAFT_1135147, partial [Collybia nuda]
YGHLCASCKRHETCSCCASTSTNCTPSMPPKCVSCGPNSTHASSAHECPVFLAKGKELNVCCPENTIPYF